MSVSAIESGINTSPVYLYKFYTQGIGGTQLLYSYTSSESNVVYKGDTYSPEVVKSTEIELSQEASDRQIEIYLKRTSGLVGKFQDYIPTSIIYTSIFKFHDNDIEPVFDDKVENTWNGIVTGFNEEIDYASIVCKPIQTAFNRVALYKTFAKQCQHFLYDSNCKVNPNLPQYKQTVTLSQVNGTDLYSSGFATWTGYSDPEAGSTIPAGWWTTGFLRIPSTGELRMITDHSSMDTTKITLLTGIRGLTPGTQVEVYAGCDRSPQTCKIKFNNIVNNGGFPYIPLTNPFQYKITTTV